MRSTILFSLCLAIIAPLTGQAPAAYLTERDTEVCLGDSTVADLVMTGYGPWTVVINDDNGVYKTLEDITSPYVLWLKPENSTHYSISKVLDRNGIEGTGYGSITMTVWPRRPVQILMDRTSYRVTEAGINLVSDPPGASFAGPGVLGSKFYPGSVSPNNSPFQISCIYENIYGCPTYDTVELNVIWGKSDVFLISDGDTINTICDEDAYYDISGTNLDGIPGLFTLRNSLTGDTVTDHILDPDSADNAAEFDPVGLVGTFDLIFEYTFDVLTVTASRTINVNDLQNLTIDGFPDLICRSDEPYLLSPANVAGDPGATYTISGPGITGNQSGGYYFDPASETVPLGSSIIVMEYSSSNGCSASVKKTIQTHFAPTISFTHSPSCLSEEGSEVNFSNTSTGKYSVEEWTWDFDDPESGELNKSSEENPVHFYSEPGIRSVSLTAITDEGCVVTHVGETVLSDQPRAVFTWVHDCFVNGEEIDFINQSVSSVSEIASLVWTFKNTGGFVLGTVPSDDPDEVIGFPFSSRNTYEVQLEVWDTEGCYDKVTREITLKPTITLGLNGYKETFDGAADGWNTGPEESTSWIRGEPDFRGFEAHPGNYAWYTELPEGPSEAIENSWVESPCFNFGSTQKPSLELDVMKSFLPGEDGAVLQYRKGDMEEWTTLGAVGDGKNWYNVSGLTNPPGGSDYGWGTIQGTSPDSTWQHAGLVIDELNGSSLVKFRVALASGANTGENEGFAFDRFSISEDFRGSVLEYFTNSSQEASFSADNVVDDFALSNTSKLVDIQYHVDYPGIDPDPMNANNPIPLQDRWLRIGALDPPYAILNGRTESEYRFDFSGTGEEPDQDLLDQASLESASFSIDLQSDWQQSSTDITVEVTCVAEAFDSNVDLYVILFETLVTAYTGGNGDTEFRNVVLDMLPAPAGKLLGSNWTAGKYVTNTFSWDYPSYVEDVEDLAVLAFVTDRDHGGVILQADATYLTPQVGISPADRTVTELSLFPNPGNGVVFVNLGEPASGNGILMINDLSGKQVYHQKVASGYTIIRMDPSVLPEGIYLVSWYQSGELKGRTKLIRTR